MLLIESLDLEYDPFNMARQSSIGCDKSSVVEIPSGLIDNVPPSGGSANVGKSDETGDSGGSVVLEDTKDVAFGSSRPGREENGTWYF